MTCSEQRLSGIVVHGYMSLNATWSWKARFWHTLIGNKLGTIMQKPTRQGKQSEKCQ